MALFKNPTHRSIWLENWCHRCFQPDEAMRRIQGKDTQCPILAGALGTGRKPKEWDRMPRADTMAKSIRCNAFSPRPELTKTKTVPNPLLEPPMFDVEPHEISYVPVDGWPDRPSDQGVDHQ
jgi:hypothetical protein